MNKTASSPLYELFAVERLNGIDATQEDKRLYGTDADDSWLVLGNVTSGNGHSLIVDLQEGNDSFRVFGNMESSGGGRTLLDFSGNSTITVSGNVVADGGRNYLRNYWGDNTINIAGRLSATGGGSNMIEMDEVERGSIRIDKGIEATGSSYNNIACGMIGSSEYSTISIDGISASDNSRNSLHFTGDNQGNYSMDLTKGVSAVGGSTNYIEFYQCSHAELDINGSVNSMEGGNNTFKFSNDRTDFTLDGNLATDHASNTLQFAGGTNIATITGSIESSGSVDFEFSGISSHLTVAGGVSAVEMSHNYFHFKEGDDTVDLGSLYAEAGGNNSLEFETGQKEVIIREGMEAAESGRNRISFYDDYEAARLAVGHISSGPNGENEIRLGGGGSIEVSGDMSADHGINTIEISNSSSELRIDGDLLAAAGGFNRIRTSDAAASVTIGGRLSAGASNEEQEDSPSENRLDLDAGDNFFALGAGMQALATGSRNMIQSWDGNDVYHLKGTYAAVSGAENTIETRAGDDRIFLDGQVGKGGLNILAGDGYDVLTLSAADAESMGQNYREWLEDAASQNGEYSFAEWGFESIQVDLAGQHGELDSLAWLGDLVDAYNTSSATPLALELNLDSYGRNLSLSDLFSGQDDDIFSGVNLGGDNQNILAVEGGLVDNGINAFTFTVNGDSGDTVRLSDDWMFIGDDSGGEGLTYSYYTTGYDLLMVQSEIAVVFGA